MTCISKFNKHCKSSCVFILISFNSISIQFTQFPFHYSKCRFIVYPPWCWVSHFLVWALVERPISRLTVYRASFDYYYYSVIYYLILHITPMVQSIRPKRKVLVIWTPIYKCHRLTSCTKSKFISTFHTLSIYGANMNVSGNKDWGNCISEEKVLIKITLY